jgi:hypothetical protein
MSEISTATFPYEKQGDFPANRMCGAAALSMVYGSFAKPISQAELWKAVSKHNRFASLAAATHLIVQDALKRGFAALAVQAVSPLLMLRICRDQGIRVILNHRLKEEAPTGHFSVLLDIDEKQVALHDPQFGPSHRVSHAELLQLWRPRFLNAEISGNVLIGIAAMPDSPPPCQLCKVEIPPSVLCAQCNKPVPLRPSALLGCVTAGCPARLWNYVCCPSCDFTWNFGAADPRVEALKRSEANGIDFAPIFAEMDKVSDYILSLPQVANHPQVLQQLDSLKASKAEMTLTQSEQLAYREMHLARLAQLKQRFKEDEQAILEKKQAMEKPGEALDGAALGQALLKDLGFFGEAEAQRKPEVPSKPAAATPSVDIMQHKLVRRAIRKMPKPSS